MELEHAKKGEFFCLESMLNYTSHKSKLMQNVCEACGFGIESSGHIFWECKKAYAVWLLSGISFDTQGVRDLEFMDLMWYLIFVLHFGNDILEMLLMIAWCVWFNRNVVRHGHSRQSAEEVVQLARFLLNEFQIAIFHR